MKQEKLFGEDDVTVCNELDVKSAQNVAEITMSEIDNWTKKIDIVGSIRRGKAMVHDIDYVALVETDRNWENMRHQIFTMMDSKPVFKKGDQTIRALLALANCTYIQIDIYRCTEENYGIQKLIRTGSAEHNVWLASRAIKQGLRLLYSKGLCKGEQIIAGSGEKDIFYSLGLEWIEPSKREMVNGKPVWLVE